MKRKSGKIQKVLHEYKTGSLHSGSKRGPAVRSRKQAVAIALSEARKAGEKVPAEEKQESQENQVDPSDNYRKLRGPEKEEEVADDQITYIDMGDYTLEIDDRGPTQVRRSLPKSLRGFGVSAAVRKELEDRIENEIVAPAKLAEEQPAGIEENLPPVEDDDAIAKREKKAREQLDAAAKRAKGEVEEQQAAASKSKS